MIEFVSYTGEYPNYCRGILTLRIDGKEYKFGHDYSIFNSWKTDGNYDDFWSSGGDCGFTNDYTDSYVSYGPWKVDKAELPDWLKDRAYELEKCLNENLSPGCCGGCL